MQRIAWTRDKPNTLLIEDDDGSTEVTLEARASVGETAVALEAHRAALQDKATDETVVVRRRGGAVRG
jgi:hypothetical protein